jgi:hypothetical protein
LCKPEGKAEKNYRYDFNHDHCLLTSLIFFMQIRSNVNYIFPGHTPDMLHLNGQPICP